MGINRPCTTFYRLMKQRTIINIVFIKVKNVYFFPQRVSNIRVTDQYEFQDGQIRRTIRRLRKKVTMVNCWKAFKIFYLSPENPGLVGNEKTFLQSNLWLENRRILLNMYRNLHGYITIGWVKRKNLIN